MRSIVTLFSLFSLNVLCSAADFENVPPAEFQELAEKGEGIILDVRTPDEIAQGHIPGASMLNFYDDDFERKLNLMQKDKPIYVYCRSGGRSAKAAKMMKENGFGEVFNLVGGIGAWNKAVLPIEKSSGVAKKSGHAFSKSEFANHLKGQRVVLADFHTPWCVPCKQIAPIVDQLEKDLGSNASILRVDLDSNPALADSYKIQGVPVFILFVDGREQWRHSGTIDSAALRAVVEKAL